MGFPFRRHAISEARWSLRCFFHGANVQRSTPNIQLRNRYGSKAIPSLRRPRSCGFVNRTNDYARYDHFDKAADAYQHEELCGKGLCRVKHAERADRHNFQHDSKVYSDRDSTPGKTAGVNHDESFLLIRKLQNSALAMFHGVHLDRI